MSCFWTNRGERIVSSGPTAFSPVQCSFMGGNSTKATSGINGAGTQTQQELGIPDNAKTFFEDTKRSVRTSNHLLPARILTSFALLVGS